MCGHTIYRRNKNFSPSYWLSYPKWWLTHASGLSFSLSVLTAIPRHWGLLLNRSVQEGSLGFVNFWRLTRTQFHSMTQLRFSFFISFNCPRVQVWVLNCLIWTSALTWIKSGSWKPPKSHAGIIMAMGHRWFEVVIHPLTRISKISLLFPVLWVCQFLSSAFTWVISALFVFQLSPFLLHVFMERRTHVGSRRVETAALIR